MHSPQRIATLFPLPSSTLRSMKYDAALNHSGISTTDMALLLAVQSAERERKHVDVLHRRAGLHPIVEPVTDARLALDMGTRVPRDPGRMPVCTRLSPCFNDREPSVRDLR